MSIAAFAPIIGAVAGGLLSRKGGTQEAKKEPWSDAQPWLRSLLAQGQALQDAYMKNPISDTQKDAARNMFGLVNSFNGAARGWMDNYAALGQGYDKNSPDRTKVGYRPVQVMLPEFSTLDIGGIRNVGASVPSMASIADAQAQAQASPVTTPGGVNDYELFYYLNGGGA